jgi:DNA gyrase/topoisomerase IV subunit B
MKNSDKSIQELYQKKTQYEHILDCPDTYIGDPTITKENRQIVVHNDNYKIIENKNLEFSPGLIKICDEIIVNARDQQVRNTGLKEIRMNIDKESGMITVYNDGEGIHTDIHPEFNIRVPELIFSHLLTSTNYDKEEQKITGGKNGFGAKLTNIYSKYFKVETSCNKTKEIYSQLFENNMLVKHEPVITKKKRKEEPFTRISFIPDFPKFGLSELTEDVYQILEKRMYDLAACLPDSVSVYFNDEKLEYNNLEKYSKLYFPESENKDLVYEKVNERWEVLATLTPSDDHFQQVSFVNGIHTVKGGKHVDYVINQITKRVAEYIKTKKKKTVKPNYIKDNLYIFINSIIVNPGFDSQTKEFLVTKVDKFGSSCDLSDKFIDKLCKTELIDRVINLTDFKEKNELKKTDGKKRSLIKIPKLEDANLAGTGKGKECTLILTEGDSAKTFAISGLSIIGRDYYGVFPLRGKFINVRDKTPTEIGRNQEIIHLKQILGLQTGKEYKNVDQLRYGRIMILTDADDDGRHIKGLLINFFEHFWPSLLDIQDFVQAFSTPVVKVSKANVSHSFYTMGEYENWKDNNNNGKGWSIKYYKGLGTSTSNEAKSYFKDMNKCLLSYFNDDKEACHKSITLAFAKSEKKDDNGTRFSDKRKDWLADYDKNLYIDNEQKSISFSDFINKDLIHFSNSDNIRSIPNMMDGLKPSQRKILYGCIKRNLYKEIKVSQLSGYISENTAYHHGEMSLQGTIIGLAQNFVGSNNINLLEPNGQFGCLDPKTEIIMWDGSIKYAKDIEIGDKLIGDDGLPRNVLQTTSGIDDMYEITNKDGLKMIVNKEHILTLYFKDNYDIKWDEEKKSWFFKYFNGITIINYYENNVNKEDGYNNITHKINEIKKLFTDSKVIDIKLIDYIKLPNYNKNSLYQINNYNNICWDKIDVDNDPYIQGCSLVFTNEYMYNDKKTRLDLFAGLVDTFGKVINNNTSYPSIEFNKNNILYPNIINNIRFIANSLGFSTNIIESNKGKTILLKLKIYGNNLDEIPCKTETKKIIYSKTKFSFTKHYTKFDVKYLGKDKFCGWQLDGNERFLLSNFTVTHNSRLLGGKDHASSRYIFTELNKLVKYLFNENDIPLLENNYDDGQKIEPIFYTPIIPMILVNGTEGIGTGYSTAVPTYNPIDIINNIRNMLNNEDINEMKPWSMGYSGTIIKLDTNKYMSRGVYKFLDFNTVEVTELPLGVWTDAYKDEIENKYIFDEKSNKSGFLIGYENHSTESTVKFILKFKPGMLTSLRTNIEKFEKMLHLYSPISSTNMHLYNEKEKITKYDTVIDIFKAFFNVRLLYYHKRREYLIKKLTRELNIIEYKIKFIEEIINETIYIFKKKKDEVIEILKSNKYPIFNMSADILKDDCDSDGNYNYLTSMPIHTFTQEKIDELKNQQELKKAEVDNINSKDEKQLWIDDLDNFEQKYLEFLDEYITNIKNEKCNKVSKKGKKRVKKVAKK